MRTFQLTIQMDNAAFEDDASSELIHILEKAQKHIAIGSVGANLFDSNGNRVGSFVITSTEV